MARRWKKFAGTTFLVINALMVLGIPFTIGWRPFIGAKKRALTDRKFEPALFAGRTRLPFVHRFSASSSRFAELIQFNSSIMLMLYRKAVTLRGVPHVPER